VVKNVGGGVLALSSIHAGCGCLRATLVGESTLGPDAAAVLRITLGAAPNLDGAIRKPVQVSSNDPVRSTAVIWVRAEIQVGITVVEPLVDFGRVAPGASSSARLHLRSPAAESAWDVTSIDGAQARYGVRAYAGTSADPAYRVIEVELTHPGASAADTITDILRVRTTHPEHAEILVRARLEVVQR
jgi:hypothetical protein